MSVYRCKDWGLELLFGLLLLAAGFALPLLSSRDTVTPLFGGVALVVHALVRRGLPLVRLGEGRIEVRGGLLQPVRIVAFDSVESFDARDPKRIRLHTTHGEVTIATRQLSQSERQRLVTELRQAG